MRVIINSNGPLLSGIQQSMIGTDNHRGVRAGNGFQQVFNPGINLLEVLFHLLTVHTRVMTAGHSAEERSLCLIFNSLDEFYEEQPADLAVISSPIPFHCQQTVLCLEHGANVLCEKPLAGSVEDGLKMAEAEKLYRAATEFQPLDIDGYTGLAESIQSSIAGTFLLQLSSGYP